MEENEKEEVVTSDDAEVASEAPAQDVKGEQQPESVEVEPEKVIDQEPHKQTAQERINELTRKRRDAERDAEYWKAKALRDRTEEPEREQIAPLSDVLPRPKLYDFENQEAYEDALISWHGKKTSIEVAEKRKQAEVAEALSSFNKKAAALREEYVDFDDVIEAPVFSPFMRNALLRSENGPEMAYFLGRPENRETAERILHQPPEQQLYELGKLEVNLLLTKKTKKATSAPEPIKPVGMGGTAKVDPDKMSDQEWYEWEKKRQAQKFKEKYGGS
jgi:hypothetical protein